MKKIIFNEKEYIIPTCWEEVTIKMVMTTEILSDLFPTAPAVALLSAYSGIPLDELRLAKIEQVQQLMEVLSFINTPYEPIASYSFEFKGVTYSCKDELVEQNFEDYISVQTVLYNHKDEPLMALPKLVAIMCKKDGETLSDFDVDERAEEFMELPITLARNIEAFFLASTNYYKEITLLSSTQSEQGELIRHKFQELENIMKTRRAEHGILSPTNCQIGIYLLYLKYIKHLWVTSSNSTPSNP